LQQQYHFDNPTNEYDDDKDDDHGDDLARRLGQELAQDLVKWIYQKVSVDDEHASQPSIRQQRQQQRGQQVVNDWKQWAGLPSHNNPNLQYTLRDTGEVVQVVDLEPDGQLRVWHAATRQERLLAADYLY
jgi:hypothetical protein